jgi:hypothetical protein
MANFTDVCFNNHHHHCTRVCVKMSSVFVFAIELSGPMCLSLYLASLLFIGWGVTKYVSYVEKSRPVTTTIEGFIDGDDPSEEDNDDPPPEEEEQEEPATTEAGQNAVAA